MSTARDKIDALVLEAGEHLDQHPTLADLSRRSGSSPFHLHRRFTAELGETPKQHVLRVRLERAAYLAAITEESILHIALEVGFRSHATFSRAFRRRFHMSPAGYRTAARSAQQERLHGAVSAADGGCRLSPVQALLLPPARLLGSRHRGAYADVRIAPFHDDDHLWSPLVEWARSEGVAHERTAWVMCLDNPEVTAGPQQRLDACIPLLGTPERQGPFAIREFSGGWYAGIEHVGHHDTVIQAYRAAADWVRCSRTHTLGTGTPVQIFRHVDRNPDHHRTEVFLPISVQ
jgi:AraC family transcriptional regulator